MRTKNKWTVFGRLVLIGGLLLFFSAPIYADEPPVSSTGAQGGLLVENIRMMVVKEYEASAQTQLHILIDVENHSSKEDVLIEVQALDKSGA